ncbi:hypothetical protein SY2F82_23600 [Streptomyces sp. Y2F8-2]|nr:hypothetical protein SY2F82_23600 [Streptomyces sp. Y2F8-2]
MGIVLQGYGEVGKCRIGGEARDRGEAGTRTEVGGDRSRGGAQPANHRTGLGARFW